MNLIGENYDSGKIKYFSRKYHEYLLMDNVEISIDKGTSVNIFSQTDDGRYSLTRFKTNIGTYFFHWIISDVLIDHDQLIQEQKNVAEKKNDLSIFFVILIILISFIFYFIFIRQKQQAEAQRTEEIKRQKQQAEENRRKADEDQRQKQERYRQAEEIRDELKRQKQWAEAQQAEENRRKAEELRQKEEELRRQAEEIKRQKERLDEEVRQRKEYSSKSIVYPRTLREAFEVFGTCSGLTLEEYKKIFKNEVIKYHPDKMKNLGERLQRQAEEEMKSINMAWDIIKKNLS